MNQDQIAGTSSSPQSLIATKPQESRHHISLADPSWALWRWSVLRGAGFPAEAPLQLAAPACVAAADQLLADEQQAMRAQEDVITLLNSIMDVEPSQRVFLANIIQNVRKGKIPTSQDLPSEVRAACATLHAARLRVTTAQATYQQAFTTALVQSTQSLQTLVAQDPFRQAVTWQNRQAVHTALLPFLAKPATTSSSQYRQHRTVLVKYLQRYALKNDTIGFFGPVGWARWTPEVAATQVQPGPRLLATRTTYLEGWGINALSQTLAAEAALRPWAVPRLVPFAQLAGSTLRLPFVKPLSLTPAHASVLGACDGTRTAAQVAQLVMAHGPAELRTPAQVYAVLETLLASRRITWDFNVAPEDPFPAQALRRRLEAITARELRAGAVAQVAQLEAAAQQVQAATTAMHLDVAIGAVETTFTALTAQASLRSAGKLYAGRTLVYEDTVRDVQVQLGGQLLQGMQRPLAGLLTSARWLAQELASACRDHLRATYQQLATRQGAPRVEFTQFFPIAYDGLSDEGKKPSETFVAALQPRFQQQWAQVLGLPRAGRRLHYTSDYLEPRIYAAFTTTGPVWPLGHYHCPDVMLDATDVAALNRGDFQYVLGELHLGMNTFDAPLFVRQHPQRAELYEAIAIDLPEPRVVPAMSSQFLPATRIHQILAQPKDFRLVTVPEVCEAPPSRTLRMGDLVVEAVGDDVIVQTRDGSLHWDALDVIGDYFSLVVGDAFSILPQSSHAPRITIDRVVVTRETWRVRADEVAFVRTADAADGYLQVRAWAQGLGMPRFLFYRTPKEKKPCYLDLASPLYVELFIKEVRRMVNNDDATGFIVSLSEMIPDPYHTWLVDAEGNHYTSEIRIAAVDQQKY